MRHISVRVASSRNFDIPQKSPRQRVLKKVRRVSSRKSATCSRIPSVFLTNVRCLRNKVDETSLKLRELSPDIAVLCETWLSDDIPDSSVSIPNYNVFRRDRDSHGGGVAIFVVNTLKVDIIDEVQVPCLRSCNSEILSCVIPSRSFLLISIYHPFWNNMSRNDEAVQCIAAIIDYCLTRILDPLRARIVLCGDFNDLRLCSDDISRLTNLKQVVNFPTRAQNALDLIFTNVCLDYLPSRLSPIANSDHVCVLWSPTTNVRHPQKKLIRKYSKSSIISFHNYIDSINWLAFVRCIDNLDDAFSVFLRYLFGVFDFFFPMRTIRVRASDKPWLNSSVKLLINARDRAFSKGKTSKYIRLRHQVINCIKQQKMRYFTDATLSKNQRKVWKTIRSLSGQSDAPNPSLPTAQQFCDYFSSVFQHQEPLENLVADAVNVTFHETFSPFEIQRSLASLKRKSCGPDNLPYWVFRDSSFSLTLAITFLFNRSISESHFPSCLKVAYVCPIPKVPRASVVSDFRPISLLPILSKVFERLVSKHFIVPYIRDKLRSSQFAYVAGPGSGTCCSLTLMYDRILHFLDAPGAVRVLSIDFSKAFDKILHRNIINSAVAFSLPSRFINWLQSYLSYRFQCVRVYDIFSSWSEIRSGVPQGSVLGPLLFCMSIDKFTSVSPNSMCIKYADDVTILHFVRNSSADSLQLEWENAERWSDMHGLPLNRSKCSIMNINTKRSLSLACVTDSSGSIVNTVNSVKVLGVYLSSDLKWNFHVDSIVKRASKRFYIFYNLVRSGCPSNLLLQTYLIYVRSILLYCFPVFCNAPEYLLSKFLRIEKRISRITGVQPKEDLLTAANAMCVRLFTAIEGNREHPLRQVFCEREREDTAKPTGCEASSRTHEALFAVFYQVCPSFLTFILPSSFNVYTVIFLFTIVLNCQAFTE